MRFPINSYLSISLDSLPATSLHTDTLWFRNATSFVFSITSHYYFTYLCISCTFLPLKEFPHSIPLPKLFCAFLPFYLYPNISSLKPPQLSTPSLLLYISIILSLLFISYYTVLLVCTFVSHLKMSIF